MQCFQCKQQIPLESKWKFFVNSHVFCSKHCLDQFNEKEQRFRARKLKQAKIDREQQHLNGYVHKEVLRHG